jgi:hypothetical protein
VSSGARWTIRQLGSPRSEDAVREATFLALVAFPTTVLGARCPAAGSSSPALGSTLGRVFVGDGDKLGDSSAPPLIPIVSGLIA